MKSKKEEVLSFIRNIVECNNEEMTFSTSFLVESLKMQRTNISTILNQLVNDNILTKINGRPVLYKLNDYIIKEGNITAFDKLIGFEGSLKNAIHTAKAAVLYPEQKLNILLLAEKGVGSSSFAKAVYEFAVEKKVLSHHAPFIKISCDYFLNNIEELRNEVFHNEDGILKQAEGGILYFDHVHLLPVDARRIIYDLITSSTTVCNVLIIFSSNISSDRSLRELYFDKIPIRIELPNLDSRPLKERYEFIQQYLLHESTTMNRDIHVAADVLHALLLYPCKDNFRQLEMDLRIGCAAAYVRALNKDDKNIYLLLKDFPLIVNKGSLFYKGRSAEIDKLVSSEYTYTFSQKNIARHKDSQQQQTIYDWIECKCRDLKSSGLNLNDIETVLKTDLEKRINTYTHSLEEHLNMESLSKIVDKKLIRITETFLEEVSKKLNKIFPMSVFYGLCMHMTAALNFSQNKQLNESIIMEIKKHKICYEMSTKYVEQVESYYHKKLSDNEPTFVSMFLTQIMDSEKVDSHPAFLIAMHGEQIAASLAETVTALTGNKQVYAYDLSLNKSIQDAYEELKLLIQKIDNGLGIFMMYDMGSLKIMGERIAEETSIHIEYLIAPITTFALECSRKISMNDDLSLTASELEKSYKAFYPFIMESYHRASMKNVIITLCMTGEGSALQLKQYLDKHLYIENAEIIALSMYNKKSLITYINNLKETHNILYIIGIDDPHLFHIPFIPISQVYSIPANKLTMLLSVGGVHVEMKGKIEYARICNNLKEELPDLDIEGIKRFLPDVIQHIDEKYSLNQDQKIGLFMHLAGSINRLCCNGEISCTDNIDSVLNKNKKLMNALYTILKPIETYFKIRYNESEIAGLIHIIKKI